MAEMLLRSMFLANPSSTEVFQNKVAMDQYTNLAALGPGCGEGWKWARNAQESMEVTRDLKSFLAAKLLPEREMHGCKSQQCHSGRKVLKWHTALEQVCKARLAGGKTGGQQAGSPSGGSSQVKKYSTDTSACPEHRLKTTARLTDSNWPWTTES